MRRPILLLAALLALAVAAAPASADTLLAPAPGAERLAAGGGYLVWSQPSEDTGWHLVVRRPDGTVVAPQVAGFTGPAVASVGSTTFAFPRRTIAVYGRDDGDLYELDLATLRESRVAKVSSSSYREHAPSVQYGRWVFVRSGGRRDGLYTWTGRGASRRLTSYEPAETAMSESRVSYPATRTVVVRRLSGRGGALVFCSPAAGRPRSVVATRYRTAWLAADGAVFQTPRYAGSGGPYHPKAPNRCPDLAASTSSIAFAGGELGFALDGEGVRRLSRAPCHGQQ
ncbi:MAG: hypothetical protein HZB46_07480 [Solirubrobacterales bacterium]|nr:hypothetical protein [Solirubrobacterales bacterium]